MKDAIKINPKDNVAVALKNLPAHTIVQVNNFAVELLTVELQQEITKGHKFALSPIKQGEVVTKYGFPIGQATADIALGEHVHTHNVKTLLSDINHYQYRHKVNTLTIPLDDRDISLYRRKNGDVAIRNDIWLIPTVGCVNAIAEQIKQRFLQENPILQNIDSIHVLSHPYGCSQLGTDHETTRLILQDMVHHPNAGAVLVIGLGCENNQVAEFEKTLGNVDQSRVKFMVAQHYDDEVEVGLNMLKELYQIASQDTRQSGKLSELKFGLECGGSDGFSGITANPMLGHFSDYIISHGGTSVLTEVPEMFGAEQILMNHCHDENTFEKTVDMINEFKNYFKAHNQPIYENPSPGNKAGGITTLEDKSLGCTQKAGQSQIIDVLKYGERLKKRGLNLLSAPGNDAVATSALIAAGCHMVLFTTGRGTPYGGVVPTVKIATNNELATSKKHWIDFNAGQLVSDTSMDELLLQFIDLIVDIANGKKSRNEINHFRELAIFKNGVTL